MEFSHFFCSAEIILETKHTSNKTKKHIICFEIKRGGVFQVLVVYKRGEHSIPDKIQLKCPNYFCMNRG